MKTGATQGKHVSGTHSHTHRSLPRALAGIRWRRRTALSVEIRTACTVLGKSLDPSELPFTWSVKGATLCRAVGPRRITQERVHLAVGKQ